MACEAAVTWRFIDKGNVEGNGTCSGNCAAPGGCKGKWLISDQSNIEMSASADDQTVLFSATDNPATATAVFQCRCGETVDSQKETPLKLKYERPLLKTVLLAGVPALVDLFKGL